MFHPSSLIPHPFNSPGWTRTTDLPHVTGTSCPLNDGTNKHPDTRTRNPKLETWDDVRFTIGASGRQGSRTLISVGRTALAERPGQPYPATFRFTLSVDSPGIEPGSSDCQPDVFPLDHEPVPFSGPAGELNHDFLIASQASFRWTSSPCLIRTTKGPPENRTRSPSLPKRCAAGTPADRPAESRPGRTRTCAILCVRQASWPLDDGTERMKSHRTQ